jgi:hypothetical protein
MATPHVPNKKSLRAPCIVIAFQQLVSARANVEGCETKPSEPLNAKQNGCKSPRDNERNLSKIRH